MNKNQQPQGKLSRYELTKIYFQQYKHRRINPSGGIKLFFRILLYLSMGFVIYYLYQFDYIIISNLNFNLRLLIPSVLLLWLGFIVSTLSWKTSLKAHDINITTGDAIYSHGISVFAKYMPGKIWVILGRASIISEKTSSLSILSTISLKEQLLYLLIGLVISATSLPFLLINPVIKIFVILTAIALLFFLFSEKIYTLSINIFEKIFNKKLAVPFISIKQAASYSYAIIGYWFLWSTGFFLFTKSIYAETSIITTFAFPLSVCYGLLAVIIPGGIGVREGIITMFLTATGIDPHLALTISIIQRLWFITGEIFIFTTAIITRKFLIK